MIDGILLVVVGLLVFLGAVLEWRIVMNPDKLLTRWLGPAVSRILYMSIGVALFVLGILRISGLLTE
jgi:hypothetical protein